MSTLENQFEKQIQAAELPRPEREFAFHPVRAWRFDFAYPEQMIAIEIEGGTWAKGRHTRGKGFENDCIKYNEATLLGWDVYRFTSTMLKKGVAIKTIEEAMTRFINDDVKEAA